jgi:hypothetical protein
MEEKEKPKGKLDRKVHFYFNMLKYKSWFLEIQCIVGSGDSFECYVKNKCKYTTYVA